MHLGVVADDVTGATDLASVLHRDGWSVIQTLGVPEPSIPPADVVIISLKIRTAPVEVATSTARAAGAYLTRAGARQIYFKYCSTFDSTDAGNIGPVIEALLEQMNESFTIACPAYPSLGRTVYLGHLFVGDQLLSESSMRHHPLTPMTDSNLVRVLARQSASPIGLVPLPDVESGADAVRARCGRLITEGCKAAIVDAVLDRHLDTIASACRELRLITGGAALGGALARANGVGCIFPLIQMSQSKNAPDPIFPVAVLSGSGSAATLEQVRYLSRLVPNRQVDPLALASDESALAALVDWARAQSRKGHVLIYSTTTPEATRNAQQALGRAEAAAVLERAFATVAGALAADGVRAFVVAGGETSGAVLDAIGVKTLRFGDEIEPGVPWTYSLDPEGFQLALKSGNFGSAGFFAKALGITA
jgi:uncharacterized protein YgbK (DUF1537 family)